MVTNTSEGKSDGNNWNDESRFPRVMSAVLCWGWSEYLTETCWMLGKYSWKRTFAKFKVSQSRRRSVIVKLQSPRRFVSSSIGKSRVWLESCVVVTTSLSILGELMAGRPGNKMEKLR